MDNFDLKKYINEGRIHSPINLNENLESQAISILKKYKNEIGEVGKYIEYLNNIPSNDDVHSAIQAIADDLDRDNYIEDDLRVELEKLSLAEGKLNENQGDMYGRGPAYQALDSGIQYYIDQFIRDIEEEKEEDGTEYLNDLIKAIAALRDSATYAYDLSEGKLLKEGMSLKFYDEDVELNADSGDYIAFIEDDGTVSFSVIDEDVQDEYEDGFDEDNWKDYLGPKHAFVQISNQIPTKVEADRDYVMITVDLKDLKNLVN
jgi:hypothetical protein